MVEFFKKIRLLPHQLSLALRARKQQAVDSALEEERLDRIRHPEKYLGK